MTTSALEASAGERSRSDQPPVSSPGKVAVAYCARDVAQHSRKEDCWVVVHGEVYDVSKWVPRHPGGDILMVRAGMDCSQLFDSYHSSAARSVLDKYWVGSLQQDNDKMPLFKSASRDTDFYDVLKVRVRNYFKANKLNPHSSFSFYVKCCIIMSLFAASLYGSFYCDWTFEWALLAASVMGVCMAEVGISVMHDANHGAVSAGTWGGWLMCASLDLIGASSFMWRQQHVAGHHAYTNLEAYDPDIRVKDPDVRREHQHIYLAVLYSLLALKSVLLDDFQAIATGRIGSLRLARMSRADLALFWGGKAVWVTYFILLPALCSRHSWSELAALWLWSESVAGWMLAFLFQVAHVTSDVEFPEMSKGGEVQRGWAATQVATTADFAHGSWFWTHISGGLNYQVVHHLFPSVCHTHYIAIAPLVVETCREFGIPYTIYPTFISALTAHFKHLKVMGKSTEGFTMFISLQTIG